MVSVTENRVSLINLFNHISIQAVFLLGYEKKYDFGFSINSFIIFLKCVFILH